MIQIPDHPQIQWIERTGYPSWLQEKDDREEDYDDDCEDLNKLN